MKRFLLLLILAIFCLPNIANAQDLSQKDYKIGQRYGNKYGIGTQNYYDEYNDYIVWAKNREQQKAYLDAKISAEITVDEATGITTITWGDGAMYRGQTYYGEIKGVGTMVYPDGSKYCGTWERDLPNGNGTFQTPAGITFTVNFENGVPHGKGVIQDLDGRLYSARWVRGVLKEKSIKPLKK
jgi:hypothetical protein